MRAGLFIARKQLLTKFRSFITCDFSRERNRGKIWILDGASQFPPNDRYDVIREGNIVESRGNTLKGLNTSKDAGKLVKLTKLNRTVCVRLLVNPEDSVKLSETHALYRDSPCTMWPIRKSARYSLRWGHNWHAT